VGAVVANSHGPREALGWGLPSPSMGHRRWRAAADEEAGGRGAAAVGRCTGIGCAVDCRAGSAAAAGSPVQMAVHAAAAMRGRVRMGGGGEAKP